MKDSWTCRNYRPGDEYAILSLYKEVNGREMSLAHWKWKFADGPFGKALMKLMFDGEKLIGLYGVVPMNVQVQQRPEKAVLSVNTMTHPEYERQGIFGYLAQEIYKECQKEGYKFVYGFPNMDSHYGFTRKLDWADLGKMTSLVKKLEARGARKPFEGGDIRQVARFDDGVDSLWARIKNNYRIVVPRTEVFLNWRFTAHPAVKYSKFVLRDSAGDVSGYVVLKVFTEEADTKGHIVDMQCVSERDAVKSLLTFSGNYFIDRGINNLSCWAPEGSCYSWVIEKEGFARKEFEVYFGARVFAREDKLVRDVEQFGNWHLTMGDLDVF